MHDSLTKHSDWLTVESKDGIVTKYTITRQTALPDSPWYKFRFFYSQESLFYFLSGVLDIQKDESHTPPIFSLQGTITLYAASEKRIHDEEVEWCAFNVCIYNTGVMLLSPQSRNFLQRTTEECLELEEELAFRLYHDLKDMYHTNDFHTCDDDQYLSVHRVLDENDGGWYDKVIALLLLDNQSAHLNTNTSPQDAKAIIGTTEYIRAFVEHIVKADTNYVITPTPTSLTSADYERQLHGMRAKGEYLQKVPDPERNSTEVIATIEFIAQFTLAILALFVSILSLTNADNYLWVSRASNAILSSFDTALGFIVRQLSHVGMGEYSSILIAIILFVFMLTIDVLFITHGLTAGDMAHKKIKARPTIIRALPIGRTSWILWFIAFIMYLLLIIMGFILFVYLL
jgi:hypothetical protein